MTIEHALPDPPELGERDGLAYALFLPAGPPAAAVVICHGAGSAKESHFDFARLCRVNGLAAIAYDARGHGRSSGEWGPTALGDALAICDLARERAGGAPVALRGSSMGGFTAIHAAALDPAGVAAVVAICPAPGELLAESVRSGRLREGMRVDRRACEPWLRGLILEDAAAALGPACALLLLHAEGDEQVPFTVSTGLHKVARAPKRLLLLPGGHHRSIQHDEELQQESVRWIERAAGRRAAG